jgi:hypothetical protein
VTLDGYRAERVITLPDPPRLVGTYEEILTHPMLPGSPGLWEVMEGPFLAGGGDLDGDGVPDVLVSNRNLNRDDPGRPNTVRGYSGDDGRLVFDVVGGDGFGCAFAFADDIDRDGCDDVHVATFGAVTAYSGRTGLPLYTVDPGAAVARTACSMVRIADRDGDGCDDLAWTTSRDDAGPVAVRIASGADGGTIGSVLVEREPGETCSARLATLGDVDADGTPDWGALVDAPRGLGSLHVHSGRTGSAILRVRKAGDVFSAAGDVDRDGHADILRGADDDRVDVPVGSGALVLSGRTARPLYVRLKNA